MTPLFAFTFHLTTVSMTGDKIRCLVFAENYSDACDKILNMGMPIAASDHKGLKDSIKEVIQCSDEEETEAP